MRYCERLSLRLHCKIDKNASQFQEGLFCGLSGIKDDHA